MSPSIRLHAAQPAGDVGVVAPRDDNRHDDHNDDDDNEADHHHDDDNEDDYHDDDEDDHDDDDEDDDKDDDDDDENDDEDEDDVDSEDAGYESPGPAKNMARVATPPPRRSFGKQKAKCPAARVATPPPHRSFGKQKCPATAPPRFIRTLYAHTPVRATKPAVAPATATGARKPYSSPLSEAAARQLFQRNAVSPALHKRRRDNGKQRAVPTARAADRVNKDSDDGYDSDVVMVRDPKRPAAAVAAVADPCTRCGNSCDAPVYCGNGHVTCELCAPTMASRCDQWQQAIHHAQRAALAVWLMTDGDDGGGGGGSDPRGGGGRSDPRGAELTVIFCPGPCIESVIANWCQNTVAVERAVVAMDDKAHLRCPCCQERIEDERVRAHLPSDLQGRFHDAYMRAMMALSQAQGEREAAERHNRNVVHTLTNQIIEKCMNHTCTKCKRVWGPFDACAVLRCEFCRFRFCGLCMSEVPPRAEGQDAGKDAAHNHVRACSLNPSPGRVFVATEMIEKVWAIARVRNINAFLDGDTPPNVRRDVVRALAPHFIDTHMDVSQDGASCVLRASTRNALLAVPTLRRFVLEL
ncbi:hypothetical protein JKP88DRAFT_279478 [Tribonema minus]|uniref:Uncharacterized protein n=1 Tax=Tribonema minus TaxID=303371 RepID=A0A836CE42_9STRA|nr:hypothetical protein JKP88DRAFT_279478 [Tribonema minus]